MSVITVLTLAGCAGDDEESASMATTAAADGGRLEPPDAVSDGSSSGAATEATEAPAATDAAADTIAGSSDGGGTTAAVSGPGVAVDAEPGRLLAVEVTAAVEVVDVADALSQVVGIAAKHGGQVYGSDVSLGDPEDATGTVVIKLPPAEVEAAIADVGALGRLVGRFQNTDDVTDTVTDVETRIMSQQQSVDRVQAMLADAKDLGEVVMLEGELTARQLELEQLLAQRRNLANRTSLATLTVQLSTAPVEQAATTTTSTTVPVVDEDDTVGDAFARGGEAFVVTGKAVLMFLGYTGPFLALGLVALLIARRATRRRRGPRPPVREPDASPIAPDPDPVTSGRPGS